MSGQKIIASAIDTVTSNLNTAGEAAGFSEQVSALNLIPPAINVVLGLLGIITLFLTVYSGFLYLTSQGNKDAVEKAKKILTYSIIGLVVIIASFAIANTLFSAFILVLWGATTGN